MKYRDTFIVRREGQGNAGFVLGDSAIPEYIAESLFKSMKVLEAQFTSKMPILVALLPFLPEGTLHVCEGVHLVPIATWEELAFDDDLYFVVNDRFCTTLGCDPLHVYDTLMMQSSNSILKAIMSTTFMLGVISSQESYVL